MLAMIVTQALAAVEFSLPPKVTRTPKGLSVEFAVSERTDVEVTVRNQKGDVVRHLAAGVLNGKNPPPIPLREGLAQKLDWNGLDDAGKAAEGGPFRVRVRAGLSAKYQGTIGGSPYTGSVVSMPYRAPVNGLVVDAKGNLFVKLMSSVGSHGNSGFWPWHLRRFDRSGNYERTLLPYSAATPRESATGFKLLDTPDGRFVPATRTSLYPVFYEFGNELLSRMIGDSVVFIRSETRELNFFAVDGSNKVRTVRLWDEQPQKDSTKPLLKCPKWLDIQVAISPDGKTAYYSNVAGVAYDGRTPSDIDSNWPQGRIYRQDISVEGSEPQPFFDLPQPNFETAKYWQPSAWDKKSQAAGIDIDAQGNVFVCDLVNHQVVEISPQGQQRSAFKVDWPDKVLVSRKTDAVYVICRKVSRGYLPPATLVKLTGRGASVKVVTELPLKGTVGGAYTLDESGVTPVLWLAGQANEQDRTDTQLLRVEDRGSEFVVTGDQFLNRDAEAITFVGYMDVDPATEQVYVTRSGEVVWRFDGRSGKGATLPIKAVDLAIGPGGDIYTWGTGSWYGSVARYSRNLQPVPLATTGKNSYGNLYGRAGRGASVCGLDVDAQGRLYATYGSNDCHVRVYGADGNLLDFPRRQRLVEGEKPDGQQDVPALITGVTGYGGSLRVDRQGNVYLVQAGLPKGVAAPPGFEKEEGYKTGVGTIYKFPPTGGEMLTKNGTVTGSIGESATYVGCGPISRWNADGSCACTKPRFDVDEFGRLYIPNGIEFTVSVRDNSDNEIIRFGQYGNYDDAARASERGNKSDIPLGWPITAGATDRAIYVGDCLNHRVVRVAKSFQLEATVSE